MKGHRQNKELSTLSHNIKYLRKKEGMSQEGFAHEIGIKRSSIAAYESKNVEPRLSVILEISKLCGVSLQALIQNKLSDDNYNNISNFPEQVGNHNHKMQWETNIEIEDFVDKSIKIRKVLDGFKAFYSFKKDKMKDSFNNKENLFYDIENFFKLMDDLLSYNESLISAFHQTNN